MDFDSNPLNEQRNAAPDDGCPAPLCRDEPSTVETIGLEPIALAPDACRRLLTMSRLGRIGITDRALPMILPVGYAIQGEDIVCRVGKGLIFDAADRGDVAVFQVDCSDEDLACGWSVTATGTLSLVTDPFQIELAEQYLDMPIWSSNASNVIRLRPAMWTGRSRCRFVAG